MGTEDLEDADLDLEDASVVNAGAAVPWTRKFNTKIKK